MESLHNHVSDKRLSVWVQVTTVAGNCASEACSDHLLVQVDKLSADRVGHLPDEDWKLIVDYAGDHAKRAITPERRRADEEDTLPRHAGKRVDKISHCALERP